MFALSTYADDTKQANPAPKRLCGDMTAAIAGSPAIHLHPDLRDPSIVDIAQRILHAVKTHDLGAKIPANNVPFIMTIAVLSRFSTTSKDTLLFADHRDSVYRETESMNDDEIVNALNETFRLLEIRRSAIRSGTLFEIPKGSNYLPLHNALRPALDRPQLRERILGSILDYEITEIFEVAYEKGEHPLRRTYRVNPPPTPNEIPKDPVSEDLQALLKWINAQPPR